MVGGEAALRRAAAEGLRVVVIGDQNGYAMTQMYATRL